MIHHVSLTEEQRRTIVDLCENYVSEHVGKEETADVVEVINLLKLPELPSA
jgi:hypothetical protein